MAAWMAVEIWHEFGADAPIIITPVHDGRFEVYVGGEKVFDRKAEGGIYPDLKKAREIKALIRQRLQSLAAS